MDKRRPVTTTLEELADAYWRWICPDEAAGIPARKRSWKSSDRYALGRLRAYFGGQAVDGHHARPWSSSTGRGGGPPSPATIAPSGRPPSTASWNA